MKVKELLINEDKWTKGYSARDSNGKGVNTHNSTATCWCLYGAICKCYTSNQLHEIFIRVQEYLSRRYPFFTISMIPFNDNPITTFKNIRDLLEECDI